MFFLSTPTIKTSISKYINSCLLPSWPIFTFLYLYTSYFLFYNYLLCNYTWVTFNLFCCAANLFFAFTLCNCWVFLYLYHVTAEFFCIYIVWLSSFLYLYLEIADTPRIYSLYLQAPLEFAVSLRRHPSPESPTLGAHL